MTALIAIIWGEIHVIGAFEGASHANTPHATCQGIVASKIGRGHVTPNASATAIAAPIPTSSSGIAAGYWRFITRNITSWAPIAAAAIRARHSSRTRSLAIVSVSRGALTASGTSPTSDAAGCTRHPAGSSASRAR